MFDLARLDLQKLVELKNKKPKAYEKLLADLQIVLNDLNNLQENIKKKKPILPIDNLCAGCKKKIDWDKNPGAFRTQNKENNKIENWCSQACNEKSGGNLNG